MAGKAPTQRSGGADFEALDETHRKIAEHLARLHALGGKLDGDIDAALRHEAAAIEGFFSSVSRRHHADEERDVFPGLLASTDVDLVAKVRMLQQDHGWIEEDWRIIGPQLRGLAEGTIGVEAEALRQAIDVFFDLCREHIRLEESIVYPQAKAAAAKLRRQRAQRSAAQFIAAGPASS
jgi:hemerythrin-like domain-containing protein